MGIYSRGVKGYIFEKTIPYFCGHVKNKGYLSRSESVWALCILVLASHSWVNQQPMGMPITTPVRVFKQIYEQTSIHSKLLLGTGD